MADIPADERAIALTARLASDVAVVEVGPGAALPMRIAARIRALPPAPTVLLTSSSRLDAWPEGFGYIAKADLCAEQILRHLR